MCVCVCVCSCNVYMVGFITHISFSILLKKLGNMIWRSFHISIEGALPFVFLSLELWTTHCWMCRTLASPLFMGIFECCQCFAIIRLVCTSCVCVYVRERERENISLFILRIRKFWMAMTWRQWYLDVSVNCQYKCIFCILWVIFPSTYNVACEFFWKLVFWHWNFKIWFSSEFKTMITEYNRILHSQ